MLLIALAALLGACSSGAPAPDDLTEQETQGMRLFTASCAACHTTSGDSVIVGPPLAGIAYRAAERIPGQSASEYLRTSIVEPDAYINEGFNDLMPKTFGSIFTDEEIDALVAFLMTLE
jgi:mono/diheme cytochrome c family protein